MSDVRRVRNASEGFPKAHIVYMGRRFFGDCLTQCLGEVVVIRSTKDATHVVEVCRPGGTIVGTASAENDPVEAYIDYLCKRRAIRPTAIR